ncbi:MAG: thioredoxin domain-containing protein, partial [Acidobacteria bacterium]|nr:thioredoxin domain-containing protein [Acidobacteriota bacterium]
MSLDRPANSLGLASSAYLRSAAHQPVRWNEWGDAAFELARHEDKPILLDIGAVWCHWCHVMDRESYENEEIARVINDGFVAVKVDRDERPDIDARYQTAVSALTGQGGWPLTAFLTPQGKPFYGGTYFTPDDRFGRPGMKRMLESIAHNYRTHKAEILASAEKISDALSGIEKLPAPTGGAGRGVLDALLESIGVTPDSRFGGFGTAPKFPHPGAIDLLLDSYLETGQTWMLTAVTTTLERMGLGGVYDQLGGGFHRYSVDERWIVPHFEKMSYDNAGLLVNYLRAYQVTGNEFFREIALGILSFVESVLSNPQAGFYASQDADYSLDDDGDYFTWTLDEVRAALDETEAEVVAQRYHVEERGEMHHNPAKNVLFVDQPFEAIGARLKLEPENVKRILERAKTKLLAARAKRPTPFVDTTIYASWNGMMISALLEAYKVLGSEGARDRAFMALDLLLEKSYDPEKGMYHSLANGRATIEGLLDDQVFVAAALLDAYEVTGTRRYFDRTLELMETSLRRFWDDERGGFFDTAKDLDGRNGSLAKTRKAFQDSPTPAGNSVGALVLDRLARLAERADFREKAETILNLFASKAGEYGLFAATYGLALTNHLRPPVEVVV